MSVSKRGLPEMRVLSLPMVAFQVCQPLRLGLLFRVFHGEEKSNQESLAFLPAHFQVGNLEI